MVKLPPLLRAMRPHQWHKNVLVYVPLVFDRKFTDIQLILQSTIVFLLLCFLSSSVYLLNDIADREQDKLHPKKRFRPIASGELSVTTAWVFALVLPLVVLTIGYWMNLRLGGLLTVYWLQNIAYSFKLKHVVLLDVLLIAFGFVLRVACGVAIVDVERFSPWLYMCITLGALMIGLGKRRHELMLMEAGTKGSRVVLDDYTIPFVDTLITIVATSTLVGYSIYTFTAPSLPANDSMMLTIPIAFYGLARYLYLIHVKKEGGAPDELVFRDKPLFLTVCLWGVAVLAILLSFPARG
ncbi:MAG TPA: decaprenyl-phosphate phosphoribosyltransferase [Anaerolineales bacterium]|nr:decaprenyl-phosphate phosphoribosyltransferase [Anaerolineales bacterium]